MSLSENSLRRAAIGAVGAGAIAGGLWLGTLGTAQAAPADPHAPQVTPVLADGFDNAPMPDWWLHHRLFHRWWWFW